LSGVVCGIRTRVADLFRAAAARPSPAFLTRQTNTNLLLRSPLRLCPRASHPVGCGVSLHVRRFRHAHIPTPRTP